MHPCGPGSRDVDVTVVSQKKACDVCWDPGHVFLDVLMGTLLFIAHMVFTVI